MRIGLISDTHVPEVVQELPTQVAKAFRGVDLILHAGDIYVPSVLDDLNRIAPVLAAAGDDDYGDILKDSRLKDKHILRFGGKTLWLLHERPYPSPCLQNAISSWQDKYDSPDIVVFGHEHTTWVRRNSGVLFVNPGSPTFLNYRRGLGTVGILNIDSDEVQAFILQL